MAPSTTLEHLTLKNEIEDAITPYVNRVDEPPYSKAELVVMAIICTECIKNRPVERMEIHSWIISNFGYYRELALQEFLQAVEEQAVPAMGHVISELEVVLNSYETPLSGVRNGEVVDENSSNGFSVPIVPGRVFLRNVLGRKPTGTFRFFDLPSELRIRIYEMVFTFPDIALGTSEDDEVETDEYIYLYQREHDPGFKHRDAVHGENTIVMGQSLQSVFASICQQAAPR